MTCLAAFCFAAASLFAVDGDTFRDPSGQSYRLWGIDAPEIGERGGDHATTVLRSLLRNHSVECEWAQSRLSYGRPVVRCDMVAGPYQGFDLACTVVALGGAEDWPRFSDGYYAACAP